MSDPSAARSRYECPECELQTELAPGDHWCPDCIEARGRDVLMRCLGFINRDAGGVVVEFAAPIIAEPPGKADMLAALDRVRADVAADRVVGLLISPIYTGRKCRTIINGTVSRLEIVGALACAQFDTMADMLQGENDGQ